MNASASDYRPINTSKGRNATQQGHAKEVARVREHVGQGLNDRSRYIARLRSGSRRCRAAHHGRAHEHQERYQGYANDGREGWGVTSGAGAGDEGRGGDVKAGECSGDINEQTAQSGHVPGTRTRHSTPASTDGHDQARTQSQHGKHPESPHRILPCDPAGALPLRRESSDDQDWSKIEVCDSGVRRDPVKRGHHHG